MFKQLKKQKGGPVTLYDYLIKSGRGAAKGYGASRKELAKQAGISNYSGTAAQNQALLAFLQSVDNGGGSMGSVYDQPESSAYGNKSIDEIRPLGQAPSAYSPNYQAEMQMMQNASIPQEGFGISSYHPLSGIIQDNYHPYLKRKQQGGVMPRLVKEVPQGFNPLRTEGNRNYYNRITEDQLGVASASGNRAAGSGYNSFLMNKLKSGVTPSQLSKKGYISPDREAEFQQYYVPKEEQVYTESNPAPAAQTTQPVGFNGEPIFTPGAGGRLAGKVKYPMRDTTGGYSAPVEFMYVDQMGKIDDSRGRYQVPMDVWTNQIGRGNRHLYDEKALQQYKVKQQGGFVPLRRRVKTRGSIDMLPFTNDNMGYNLANFLSNSPGGMSIMEGLRKPTFKKGGKMGKRYC